MEIAKLIKEARQGSLAAQKYLFELHAHRLLLLCRRYVKNAEDAEEVLLDGYYQFFKSIGSFEYKGEAALYQCLKQIMINRCLRFLETKSSFLIVPEAEAEDIPLPEEALDYLSAVELFELISRLPVGYRTVFNLYHMEGMNHEKISALLNITAGASKSQLSRARALLQKTLTLNKNYYAKQARS